MFEPGDIYWANVPDTQRHLVVVVSAERFNRGGYSTVVPVTSRHFERRRNLRNCVPFRKGECGFSEDCVAQPENIFTLHETDLDLEKGLIAKLDEEKLHKLVRAIGHVIDADCEHRSEGLQDA